MTLRQEAGEPFSCFHDPNGLPYKVIYFPMARDLFPGKEDMPSDLDIKMRLVAPDGGNKLQVYLTDTLGMRRDIDFERHPNGQRGGMLYFDILNDEAVNKLVTRADEVGAASAVQRGKQREAGVPSVRRP